MLAQQEEAKKAGRHDYSAETEGMSKSEKQIYNRQLINEARKSDCVFSLSSIDAKNENLPIVTAPRYRKYIP